MDKFARIAQALNRTTRKTHPGSPLPRPLVRSESDFFRPLDFGTILSQDRTRRWFDVIDSAFLDRFLSGQLTAEECRWIGFREQTSRPELIERTVLEVTGTVLTCQLALRYGIASNTAGGTHHAHATMGAGYTILNDLAVAASVLTRQQQFPSSIRRVLVVDCDVHQGDGTARFHADPGLPLHGKLFTLSLHCASNYPTPKARSTIDVGLPDGMEDDAYLKVLWTSLEQAFRQVLPDFVIYDAGVDVYAGDRLGRLRISEPGIRRRDRMVVDYCVTRGVPVATVVGGGYDKDVDALARRHAIVIEEAGYVWRKHNLWKRAPAIRIRDAAEN
jgi:acetoin utilization deacetylase AcuC-like enzyme